MHKLFTEFNQNENITTKSTILGLYRPMLSLVEFEMIKDINNEYANDVLTILRNLKIVETKWESCVKGYAFLFNEFAEKINDSSKTLKIAKEYFKNQTKTKSIWTI